MMYDFERVVNGLAQYIQDELYMKMTDVQEFAARVFVGRVINNTDSIKETLKNNGYIRTFGIIDEDGNVDVCGLAKDIKREIERKGKVSFTIPLIGKLTFSPSDVNNLYRTITGEEM